MVLVVFAKNGSGIMTMIENAVPKVAPPSVRPGEPGTVPDTPEELELGQSRRHGCA